MTRIDLAEHVRELAAAVSSGGTTYEQSSRARMAAEATHALRAVGPLLDPYGAGGGR